MAARLGPLGHDQVDAGLLRRNRFVAGADLPRHEGAARVGDLNDGGVRVLVEELDDPGARCRRLDDLDRVGVQLLGRRVPDAREQPRFHARREDSRETDK